MSDEHRQSTNSANIFSTPYSKKSPPAWMAQAIVILEAWKERELLDRLNNIQWYRPAKRFVLTDLVLVLVLLAVSGAPSVRCFYKDIKVFSRALASIWGRRDLPSRSTFSKMLRALEPSRLEALEAVFLDDTIFTMPSAALTGIVDHFGGRHLLFDMDPTKMASLEGNRAEDPTRQPVLPRRREATAPGYPGRKRADRVRSRATVMMSSAGLWMLTFGQAGNGRRALSIERTCARVCAALDGLGVPRSDGVVRMDGEWGRVATLLPLVTTGLGFLCRGIEYHRLLGAQEVQAALAQGAAVEMSLPDSPVTRQVFDVPRVVLSSPDPSQLLVARVVVTRFALPKGMKKPSVGCLIDGWVYELFLTDRRPEAWTAPEVVSLYLGRGGFERTLALEDVEMQTDRWITNDGLGLDLWQMICQWVWNQRVVLGTLVMSAEEPLERTLAYDVPSLEIDPIPVDLTLSALPSTEPETDEKTLASTPGPWGSERFSRDAQGVVRCPAGQQMRLFETRRRVSGWRQRYRAPVEACSACEYRLACRGPKASRLTSRAIDLPSLSEIEATASAPSAETSMSSSPSDSSTPSSRASTKSQGEPSSRVEQRRPLLMMHDLKATKARQAFGDALRLEQVLIKEGRPPIALEPSATGAESRSERAHRRMTWKERLARNARGPTDATIEMEVTGVPQRLAVVVGLRQRKRPSSHLTETARLPQKVVQST